MKREDRGCLGSFVFMPLGWGITWLVCQLEWESFELGIACFIIGWVGRSLIEVFRGTSDD